MTALPTEEALREMRAHVDRSHPGQKLDISHLHIAALLDCALTIRRLERWLRDNGDRYTLLSVNPNAECKLYVEVDEQLKLADEIRPDLLAALDAALTQAGAE